MAIAGAWAGAAADEIDQLLEDLNADRYEVREHASDRLAQWAEIPDRRHDLAKRAKQVLLRTGTPFEVRARLKTLLEKLPPVESAPQAGIAPEELDRLFEELNSDRFSARAGALARLQWLIGRPELAGPIVTRLKVLLTDPAASAQLRRQLNPLWQSARQVWLTSDPTIWQLPAVASDQVEAWLDAFTQPQQAAATRRQQPDGTAADAGLLEDDQWISAAVPRTPQQWATQELLDLLARDEYLPVATKAIQRRLADPQFNPEASADLDRLLQWTKPAMVAEYWEDGRHLGIQYLLIGIPNHSTGALRPSHFDRADDQTAHCVSGNALSPGDYPVGVLFPHPDPQRSDAQFHLVNLPTVQRRLAYEYQVKVDDATRLAALSERTLAALLSRKRPLTEAELMMLGHLDAEAVSRFAGPYLMSMPDPGPQGDLDDERDTRLGSHAALCQWLARIGTREAVPGLLEALQAGRIEPPSRELPYHWGWLAALSIARRDPWPGVEDWLASLLERTDPLEIMSEAPPELGATAAAVLLAAQEVPLGEFGLLSTPNRRLVELGLVGCRFTSPDERQKLLDWRATFRQRAATH